MRKLPKQFSLRKTNTNQVPTHCSIIVITEPCVRVSRTVSRRLLKMIQRKKKRERERKKKSGPGKCVCGGGGGGGGRGVPNDFNYQTRQRKSWCCGRVCVWCTACRHTAPALHSSTASIGLYPPYVFLYWPTSTIRIPILAYIHHTHAYIGLYPPYTFLYWPISTIRIPILAYIHHTHSYIGLYPPYALSPSDLLCLRSSRTKYNASAINYYLLFFFFFFFFFYTSILITERVFCFGL